MTGGGSAAFLASKNIAADGLIFKPFTMAKIDEALQRIESITRSA
jgi:hypothetical protein